MCGGGLEAVGAWNYGNLECSFYLSPTRKQSQTGNGVSCNPQVPKQWPAAIMETMKPFDRVPS